MDSISEVPDDRLIDASEVAQLLHVPLGWVRRHTQNDDLPCLRLGRYRRYQRSAIQEWIDAGGAS